MVKRITFKVLVVALLLSLTFLAACSTPEETAPEAGQEEPAEEVVVEEPAEEAEEETGEEEMADGFDWRQAEGTKLTVFLNETPMAVAIRENIDEFTELTGIEIDYLVVSENEYWSKLTVDLTSGAGEFDVFMSGASMNWGYASANQIQALDPYMNDPSLTPDDWDYEDFYDWTISSQRWDGTAGPEGLGEGELWALPINAVNSIVTYRKDVFDEYGISAPDTWDDWYDVAYEIQEKTGGEIDGKPFYSVAARGAVDITTLSGPFMSGLFSYGASDFNDDLTPAMNEPAAVEYQKIYMDVIKDTGTPEWPSQMWFDVQNGFGSGQYAMVFDVADFVPTFEGEESAVAGKLGYALPPAGPDGFRNSFPWCWGFSMNSQAEGDTAKAAWLFIMWASSKDTMVTFAEQGTWPTRESVWNDPAVVEYTNQFGDGEFRAVVDEVQDEYADWMVAPMTDLGQVWTIWANGLHDYYFEKGDMQTIMDQVAADVTEALLSSGTLEE